MAKQPPPLSLLRKPAPKNPVVAIKGSIRDADKDHVSSAYKRLTNDVPKVKVEGGKLVGSRPPIAPSREKRNALRKIWHGSENKLKNKCYCGCGKDTSGLFARGHVRKLYAALRAIERGDLTPDEALTPQLVELLGPWVPYGPGHTPTNSLWDIQ